MLPSGLGERGNDGGWSRGLAGAVRLAPGKELFEPLCGCIMGRGGARGGGGAWRIVETLC